MTRAPVPPNGRGSPHQLRQRHTESIRDEQQVVDERRVCPLLDPVDGFPVKAGDFSKSLLRELLALTFGSDAVPDGPALLQDPVGHRVGWHGYTLVGPVIDVCTIGGTFPCRAGGVSATHPGLKHSFE